MEVQWKFHVTPNRVIFVQKRKFKNIKEAKEALRTKHEGGENCVYRRIQGRRPEET